MKLPEHGFAIAFVLVLGAACSSSNGAGHASTATTAGSGGSAGVGGAIAMGHPIGATGGMIVGALLDELERRNLKRGVVSLCAAGGIGIATVIESI